MKQQTLKLEIPKGMMIDSVDAEAGEVTLKPLPKDVTRTIKTFDDVLKDHGIEKSIFETCCVGLSEDEVAYRKLKLIVESLNEGWKPDWNDGNQRKYFPWFYMGGSSGFRCHDCDSWYSASNVGSRLCFKTYELAEYAAKQFTEIYKQFML